jgi:hypothetical protein
MHCLQKLPTPSRELACGEALAFAFQSLRHSEEVTLIGVLEDQPDVTG